MSICLGTFKATTSEQWLKMCDVNGLILSEEKPKNDIVVKPSSELSHQELRDLRIAYYKKLATT
jgi:hypothetical protein